MEAQLLFTAMAANTCNREGIHLRIWPLTQLRLPLLNSCRWGLRLCSSRQRSRLANREWLRSAKNKKQKKKKPQNQQPHPGSILQQGIQYSQQYVATQQQFQNQLAPQELMQPHQYGQFQHVGSQAQFPQQSQMSQLPQDQTLDSYAAGPSTVAPMANAQGDTSAAKGKAKKGVRCWKCAVDTHAAKDCMVHHYCYICDKIAHPTLCCPILKLPKPNAFCVGCGS